MPDPNTVLLVILGIMILAFMAGILCGLYLAGQRKPDTYTAPVVHRREEK